MTRTIIVIEKNPTGLPGLQKAKARGLQVVFLTSNRYVNRPGPADLPYIDLLVETDTNAVESILRVIEQLPQRASIRGVTTFFEYFVVQVARVAFALGLPGLDPVAAVKARDKYLMREAFARAGVPSPDYRLVTNLDEAQSAGRELGYPNVLKPIDLAASRLVMLNRDPSELAANFETIAGQTHHPYGQELFRKYRLRPTCRGRSSASRA